MITTRARGLANLHAGVTTLAVGIFFGVYAEFIMRFVPIVRLSREVNLIPYFACVLAGMLLSSRVLLRMGGAFHGMDVAAAARLAARQVGYMAVLTFAMMFATLDRSISRLFLGTFLVWSWIGLVALNLRLPRALARLVFHRDHQLPTLFIGRIAAFARLQPWVMEKRALGLTPLGYLTDDPAPVSASELPGVPLGRVADLARVLAEQTVGQVILLELPRTDAEAQAVITLCQERGCRLLIHNDSAAAFTHPLASTTEAGRHFFTLQEEPLEDPLHRLLKRTLDIFISLPVVVLVLPSMSVGIWLAQRWQSRGPLFHVRERRGQNGRTFRMIKFRSMHLAAANAAAESMQASAEDARVFPAGRFLRRHSIDEFPQFWNVLIGDMSVVGPRPYMPLLDEAFRQRTRGYRTRHLVKPGITGLAQSLGFRGEIVDPDLLSRRLQWDVHYITHWSLLLDLQIIGRTLGQVFWPPRTAY